MALCGLDAGTLELLRNTRLERIFCVEDTLESALDAFRRDALQIGCK
jgi:hypothetical protein